MIATLTVFAGPMFAGKTSALIAAAKAAIAADDRPVVIIKPAMDTRFSDRAIVSHDAVSHIATPVASAADVFATVATAESRAGRTVHLFADEVQFMDRPGFDGDFHRIVHTLLLHGHDVTCGGLDCDWQGLPFDVTARLLAMADNVTKLSARCAVTGRPARKSYKRTADAARLALGAADTYEPRCNEAWEGAERMIKIDVKLLA